MLAWWPCAVSSPATLSTPVPISIGNMRVAIVPDRFLPTRDPVTAAVLHLVDELRDADHEILLIAPDTPRGAPPADRVYDGIRVHRVPALRRAGRAPTGLPWPRLRRVLRGFGPDVVHLIGPGLLGYGGLRAARRLRVPVVAVEYGGRAGPAACHLSRRATRTLTVGQTGLNDLVAHRIPRLHYWPAGRVGTGAGGELVEHYRQACATPRRRGVAHPVARSEEHTSELQSRGH